MQQEVKAAGSGEVQPTDIIFECPQCRKSLAIDVRGAGYIVTCPDCRTQIQVPGMESEEGAGEALPGGVPPPVPASPEDRIAHLERLRHLDRDRLQQISGELALIQASIDRVMGLLEDAQVVPPPVAETSDELQ